MNRLSPTSRAATPDSTDPLGFRSAPPQALCWRRAPRAKATLIKASFSFVAALRQAKACRTSAPLGELLMHRLLSLAIALFFISVTALSQTAPDATELT